MTRLKYSYKTVLFFVLFFLATTVQAQTGNHNNEDKGAAIQRMLDTKTFVFKAQTALPLRGQVLQLTSEYDMRLAGDTLIAFLPYFGRAFSAPMSTTEGGINFTTTSFGYNVQPKKRNKGWNVVLTPTDARDTRQLMLNVNKSGFATLLVTSNNRQPISFNGYVTDKSKR